MRFVKLAAVIISLLPAAVSFHCHKRSSGSVVRKKKKRTGREKPTEVSDSLVKFRPALWLLYMAYCLLLSPVLTVEGCGQNHIYCRKMEKNERKSRGAGTENKQSTDYTDFVKICLEVRSERLLPSVCQKWICAKT